MISCTLKAMCLNLLSAAFPQSLTFKGKMTTSLKFKEKATELDTRSYKCLLLALVKLIHADPKLMLHVSLPQHSYQNDFFYFCFSCTQVLMLMFIFVLFHVSVDSFQLYFLNDKMF